MEDRSMDVSMQNTTVISKEALGRLLVSVPSLLTGLSLAPLWAEGRTKVPGP